MKTFFFCLVLFLLGENTLLAQGAFEVQGYIYDGQTKEPIPFANCYNKTQGKGTISNTDGYFRMAVSDVNDVIVIAYFGYKEYRLKLKADQQNYLVYLDESALLMHEITIRPDKDDYLYDEVFACKKNVSSTEKVAKGYYELKSFADKQQIELVEGYYNVSAQGHTIKKLSLKAGRIALRERDNGCFASLESSRALLLMNLFEGSNYFPTNPLELSKKQLKKNFKLSLSNTYVEASNDSIYVLDYKPRDTTGTFFSGKMWINTTKKCLMKMTLNCTNAKKHPFLPIFSIDSLSAVDLDITHSFISLKEETFFRHTDFTYSMLYTSRVGRMDQFEYRVRTTAVLYAYDYENRFFTPCFRFGDENIGDYRKINAFPYNEFFWTNHQEYKLNDQNNTNEAFYTDSTSRTNQTIFKKNDFSQYGFFEHRYIAWSSNRVKFREILPDTTVVLSNVKTKAELYQLGVKIFFDYDVFNDSIQVITSTVFDPYESFYHLPIDNTTHCFINTYFDLWEIGRRELQVLLNQEKESASRLTEVYEAYIKKLEQDMLVYLRAVDRGTNETAMRKYSDSVYEKIGINNVELFQPFE